MRVKRKKTKSKKIVLPAGLAILSTIGICNNTPYLNMTDVYSAGNFCKFAGLSVFLLFVFLRLRKSLQKWWFRKRYLTSSISRIDKMDGKEFEKYLKAYFEKRGYKVSLTKDSGDFGADLIMKKKGLTIIVQAKRYAKNVGIEAIQQIVGAKQFYNADICAVATNRYFTQAAKTLAYANDVILYDRKYFWGQNA